MYLPQRKILLAGDLLTAPVPFGADSHPHSWIDSLKTLERLDVEVIIPGHGEAQHDKKYLQLVRESLESVTDQVHSFAARHDSGRNAKVREVRHHTTEVYP